jgi:glycerophosphoryl diester phosphodiesterase
MTRNTMQRWVSALGSPAVPAGLCLLLLTLFVTPNGLAKQPDSAAVPTAPQVPSRTLIIAHRGASAHLPEHTLASYALAYGMGADAIEPDVVMTKDDVLICAHDLTIQNAAAMEATFDGSRRRADGKWYYIDFTLDELRSVQATLGRDAGAASDGGAAAPSGFSVTTLSEMALLVQRLNRTTGRGVAIVPEPKSAKFHTQAGKDIAAALVRELAALGYTKRTDACVIQSFELETLRRMRAELKCDLPLVYLFGDPVAIAVLDDVATFADGIGPSRKLIESDPDASGKPGPGSMPGLLTLARDRGLKVYTWTLRGDPEAHRRFIEMHRVDGLFTDTPELGQSVR